ncbi:hypothetical protein [Marinicrinis sediminis]|uniref:Uncharacterized protein n=1 Tax=Marinicrinis sediminis TaxID=1652465 RepID=A0ABW5R6A2_9BACL
MIIDEKYIQRPYGLNYGNPVNTNRVQRIARVQRVEKQFAEEQREEKEAAEQEQQRQSFQRAMANQKDTMLKRDVHLQAKHDAELQVMDSRSAEADTEEEWVRVPRVYYDRLIQENEQMKRRLERIRGAWSYRLNSLTNGELSYLVELNEEEIRSLSASMLYEELQRTKEQAARSLPLESPEAIHIDRIVIRKSGDPDPADPATN